MAPPMRCKAAACSAEAPTVAPSAEPSATAEPTVVTPVEVATALALNTYGTEVALVMVLGFIMNLVFAKLTPFKSVFLTGQHFLYFSCVLALVFIALGLPMWVTAEKIPKNVQVTTGKSEKRTMTT